jgi:hypothetical protein
MSIKHRTQSLGEIERHDVDEHQVAALYSDVIIRESG